MKIAVIGFGKMGSWLAKGIVADNEVAIYDIDSAKTRGITQLKVLSGPMDIGAFRPEMLINAVNIQNIISAFESIVKYLPRDCIISDVASIKGELPRYYQKSGFRFASVHPMFGPTFAKMDSLKDENAIIISESDKTAADFFRTFFKKHGLNISDYSFEEHDKLMAYSLTLPFTASIVFAACLNRSTVPGTTFARHRSIARGLLSEDDFLLAEVLFNTYSLTQLEKINSRLELLKHIIKARDYEEAQKFFAKLRENLV
ncbi:MAG: prephenate dehydrogenase [Planctomycetes bacterium]|nr:prephenate dehydrogenase [Planctomycetota bacterium]